jgi:hypothetical protein
MTQYTTTNEYGFPHNAEDIRGARLLGKSKHQLGIVRDALYEPSTGDFLYLVVEHGAKRHVLVPSDRVRRPAKRHGSFESELTADDLNRLPAFDPKMLRDYLQWRNYEKLYRSSLSDTLRDKYNRAA